MSTSRMRQLLLAFAILAAAGVFAITGYYSFREAERDAFAQLNDVSSAWAEALGSVFETAQITLEQAAREAQGRPSNQIQPILRRATLKHPVFREAGWIVNGELVCTSYSVVEPPMRLDRGDFTDPPAGAANLGLIPPRDTYLGSPSLTLTKRVDEHTFIDVLISPKSITTPLRYLTRSRPISVFVLRGDGHVLLEGENGIQNLESPETPPPEGASRASFGRVISQRVGNFDAYVVAILPHEYFHHSWLSRLPTFGAIALLAAVLFLAGALQLRSRYFGFRSELIEATRKRQFQPYFQPIVDLATGECRGAELLMRWIHPKRGLIPPLSFIMEAERNGLISEMTLAMVERENLEIRELLRRHPEIHLAINISAPMLQDPTFLDRMAQAIGGKKFLKRLHFEITESISAGDTAAQQMTEYKRAGVELAVDDFGTGYSNLRYLQSLPFDYLKIDKAFVDGIATTSESSGLIDSIIAIGQKCSLKLIAEGIETQAQAVYLRRAGVEFGQGYFFGRPQPIDEFTAWLGKRQGQSKVESR